MQNKHFVLFLAFLLLAAPGGFAQRVLSLDSCRALALGNNRALLTAMRQSEVAQWNRKAAKTNYLPKFSAVAGYTRSGREISILNDEQKNTLSHLGTQASQALTPLAGQFQAAAQQILAAHPQLAPLLGSLSGMAQAGTQALNGIGSKIADAFRTDTRDMAMASVLFTQPLYMGGKIRAYNRITQYAVEAMQEGVRAEQQEVILNVDQAYWQVVSLSHKKRLAESYLEMLRQLDKDVEHMVKEGVATRSNKLAVDVKMNEAEMTLVKVNDGLTLSRMLLAYTCGLVASDSIVTQDERADSLTAKSGLPMDILLSNYPPYRPEIRQLELSHAISEEKVKVLRADYLPHLALVGAYHFSTPSVFNGFERKIYGDWNLGITLSVPVWNWGESKYKIAAAKAEAKIAQLRLSDTREKINLQKTRALFQVTEADKKLALSRKNLDKAEENLRVANVGFREGVITATDVLGAHTAWLEAKSDKIDAQIDTHLTRAAYERAIGTLSPAMNATAHP